MNRVGFVFQSTPHSTTSGREGLDAILATASYSNDVCLFFIGDGVLQLLNDQKPNVILSRDYIASFNMLDFYDIEGIFVSDIALLNRGITEDNLCMSTNVLSTKELRQQLSQCAQVIVF